MLSTFRLLWMIHHLAIKINIFVVHTISYLATKTIIQRNTWLNSLETFGNESSECLFLTSDLCTEWANAKRGTAKSAQKRPVTNISHKMILAIFVVLPLFLLIYFTVWFNKRVFCCIYWNDSFDVISISRCNCNVLLLLKVANSECARNTHHLNKLKAASLAIWLNLIQHNVWTRAMAVNHSHFSLIKIVNNVII